MKLKEKLIDWKRRHFGYVKVNGEYSSIKEDNRLIDECHKNGGHAHCVFERKGKRYEYDT